MATYAHPLAATQAAGYYQPAPYADPATANRAVLASRTILNNTLPTLSTHTSALSARSREYKYPTLQGALSGIQVWPGVSTPKKQPFPWKYSPKPVAPGVVDRPGSLASAFHDWI
eukprot:NODE_12867_length_495_cov_254.790323_g12574_i0.p1 GENE.NODE_12867_length_495_cov_254.790323_g12574_i0~~NODE_12867_length_495_cov_254.790323_g12574_i0.p1  ORF type:complete len:115 (-),score=6.06 NODE_12867_length_495_cov_254.790323_g12574_i0:94-438(-)